jgi:DNA processing protein
MTPLARRLFELSFLRGVGAVTLRKLVSERRDVASASVEDLRFMDKRLAKALLDPGAFEGAQALAAQQLEAAGNDGARILASVDSDYPALLRRTEDAPAFLYVRGDPAALADRSIGVIGTREPSRHGLLITERLTQYFAERGWTIVSGLALGCDAAAHRAALACGGRTVAVLAHGLQTVAPRQHAELAAEILEKGGALVTEYPYGTDAAQHQFVQRDRIQAGLSRGVVMIQSDLEGGSLHASRAALRYGRVLAVPRPTQADVEAGYPKIKANKVLADGSAEERMELLQCHAEALNRLRIIASRDDYEGLERELEAAG